MTASILVAVGSALATLTAGAAVPPLPDPGALTPLGADVQHLHFRYGPLQIPAGQNLILIGPVTIEKPAYDGYVIGFRPNLVGADGLAPPTDVVHLHHGVFLNLSRPDTTAPREPQRFYATGEEKTALSLPSPYGYFVRGSDTWAINYMLHNQTPQEQTVWITYDVDFVPAASALGQRLKPVTPIWLDVRNGEAYPVFDVHRASGSAGRYTYPKDAADPYPGGNRLNEWLAPHAGTLVAAAGHLHPGGLYDDLDVIRAGATTPATTSAACSAAPRRHRVKHRRARARRGKRHARTTRRRSRATARRRVTRHRPKAAAPKQACPPGKSTGIIPGSEPHSVRIFRSEADYFDPAGPISWDMAMTRTPMDWRVALRKGDRVSVNATYETQRASWYESMGIIVAFFADDSTGTDPFSAAVDQAGYPTHGHLPENNNHGGQPLPGATDPSALPDGQTLDNGVAISGFQYLPGNLGLPGDLGLPPVVRHGQSLTFGNFDASAQIFHTITACRQPCNRSTGLDYPLADGPIEFDSGQLGSGPPGFTAAAQRETWSTPANLPPGTYTYFCRIHPFMRGSFRVAAG